MNFARPQTACEKPPPTQKELDFGRIDTPQEAVQLTIMEPTFQYGLISGLSVRENPGLGLSARLEASNYSDSVNLTHGLEIAAQPDGSLAAGRGSVANHFPSTSKLTKEGGSVVYTETFGETRSELRFTGKTIEGNLGTVPVKLDVDFYLDDQGLHLDTRGTVGGQPYEVKTGGNGDGWTSRGNLNGVAIDKRYAVEQEGNRLSFRGVGDNAGMPQSVGVTVEFKQL